MFSKIYTMYGNSIDAYYTQTNNPTEEAIRKDDAEDRNKFCDSLRKNGVAEWIIKQASDAMGGYLETCGPTSAASCVHAIGRMGNFFCPGNYRQQPEQVAQDWFSDPRNYEIMKNIRPATDPSVWQANRIPQFYPPMLQDVFNVKGVFQDVIRPSEIINEISRNRAIMACLINPGHYVAIVGYNQDTGGIIYNDPWPGNYWPSRLQGTTGFNREMTPEEYAKNVYCWAVIIG